MNLHQEAHKAVESSVTEALFLLMSEKPFEQITVSELIRRAGVARSTYYRNYSSMREIIVRLIDSVFDAFMREFPGTTLADRTRKDYIWHVFHYVEKYSQLLSTLRNAGLSAIYLEEFNRHLLRLAGPDVTQRQIQSIYAIAGAEFNMIFYMYLDSHPAFSRERMQAQMEAFYAQEGLL